MRGYELRAVDVDLTESKAWPVNFERAVRNAVRGLWAGQLDYYQAWEVMDVAITNGFTRAWWDGAADVGIAPDELTPAERAAMGQAIVDQRGYIDGFLSAIEAGSKANGGKLAPQLVRARLWTKRYTDVKQIAMAMAGADKKLKWIWHPEAEHCTTCGRLHNQIRRGSFWQAHVLPNSPKLECVASANGVPVCKCTLTPTDEPCTPGPLPMGL